MDSLNLSAAARITHQPPLGQRVAIFTALAILDIGFNAAAGAAAASTGAHVNSQSNSATAHNAYNLAHVLGLGALGGVMKSGILALVGFSKFGGVNLGILLIMVLLFSNFGISVIITSAISSLSLGEVPGGLLIAAIVTAIPLSGELVGVQLAPDAHHMGIFLLGLDALAGYVFARMAHNEGHDICAYNAAAAAGAVYGTLTCINSFLVWCIKGNTTQQTSYGANGCIVTTSNRFGSYTIHDPLAQPPLSMNFGMM